tara:strand:- start:12713 stop:13087 length:375 start_codon:yes stop_codon:yes gene_type:complete
MPRKISADLKKLINVSGVPTKGRNKPPTSPFKFKKSTKKEKEKAIRPNKTVVRGTKPKKAKAKFGKPTDDKKKPQDKKKKTKQPSKKSSKIVKIPQRSDKAAIFTIITSREYSPGGCLPKSILI